MAALWAGGLWAPGLWAAGLWEGEAGSSDNEPPDAKAIISVTHQALTSTIIVIDTSTDETQIDSIFVSLYDDDPDTVGTLLAGPIEGESGDTFSFPGLDPGVYWINLLASDGVNTTQFKRQVNVSQGGGGHHRRGIDLGIGIQTGKY